MTTPEQQPLPEVPGANPPQGLPDDNDGIEQDAFEAWAVAEGFDMSQHPLYWLFLNPETSAARRGWRAGICHARDRTMTVLERTPREPELVEDDSLHAKINAIGNEIHNLGCDYQADEDLSVRLAALSSRLWNLAITANATGGTPQAAEETDATRQFEFGGKVYFYIRRLNYWELVDCRPAALTWTGPGETPHSYRQDTHHGAGDCAVCGHPYEEHQEFTTPTPSAGDRVDQEGQFQRWWRASRYCQVIYPEPHMEQIARDGYFAARRDLDTKFAAVRRERDKALRAPEMWCQSCGTVTRTGRCDCTEYGDPSNQQLEPHAATLAKQARDFRARVEAAEEEIEALKHDHARSMRSLAAAEQERNSLAEAWSEQVGACEDPGCEMCKRHGDLLTNVRQAAELTATRLFRIGDRVTKRKGASWTGRVVGFYSTSLTPCGYDVESENEPGSVQLYPEAALVFAPEEPRG